MQRLSNDLELLLNRAPLAGAYALGARFSSSKCALPKCPFTLHVGTYVSAHLSRSGHILAHGLRLTMRPWLHGYEFTARAFTEWCEERKIDLHYIEPGKADQNSFIERFNRTHREEALDAHLFESLEQVREITESWIPEYNQERPHDSLSCVPPPHFQAEAHNRRVYFSSVCLTGGLKCDLRAVSPIRGAV